MMMVGWVEALVTNVRERGRERNCQESEAL